MEAVPGDPLGRKAGDRLWPEWFTDEMVQVAKRDRRSWNALYQKSPSDEEGTFFRKEWFRRYTPDQLPKTLHKYLTTDHAPAGEEDSDYTCARVWGVDATGDLWLVDGFRHQETMDVTSDRLIGDKKAKKKGLIEKHKPFAWFPEDDNNWKAVAGFVTRRMREEKVHCRIEPMSPHGHDKQVKAQPFQAMASMGRVWLPVGPEGDDVLEQYLKFPAGKNDDEVDAASIIGRAIDMAHPALTQPTESTKKPDSWDRAFGSLEEQDNWRTV